jgi:plastocyanin
MTVVGTEMSFDAPDRVPAGDYTVTFRNEGNVSHEVSFSDPDGEFAKGSGSVPARQFTTMDIELTPGTWELGCHELGHYEAGMHRKLVVTSSD